MDMSWLKQTQSADEYLQHAYEIPAELPVLPLTDEPFAARWREVQGREVPDVLLSGDHGKVDRWRLEQAVTRTFERRPDMLEAAEAAGELTKEEQEILDALRSV